MVLGARRDATSPQTERVPGVRRPQGAFVAGVGPEAIRRSRRCVHGRRSRPLVRVAAIGQERHWMAALRGDLSEAVTRDDNRAGDPRPGRSSLIRLSAVIVLIAG